MNSISEQRRHLESCYRQGDPSTAEDHVLARLRLSIMLDILRSCGLPGVQEVKDQIESYIRRLPGGEA